VIEGEVAPGEMEDEGPFAVKRVTVVDVDVDIRDPSHVDWAPTTFPNF
jgi:3-polyprenyl-4-hydroxybenzoate decarboxylase